MMALCGFFFLAAAQNQIAATKSSPLLEPPPDWAFAINPATGESEAAADPLDATPRHLPKLTVDDMAAIAAYTASPHP